MAHIKPMMPIRIDTDLLREVRALPLEGMPDISDTKKVNYLVRMGIKAIKGLK